MAGILQSAVLSGNGFTMDVCCDTSAAPGSYLAAISFTTNNPEHSLYTIPLTVTISDGLLMDNGDPGFRVLPGSSFLYATNRPQAVDGDFHYSSSDSGANLLEWAFTGLVPGVYDVAATWFAQANRATNTPFVALDGSGTTLATARVNQELSPNDFTSQGAVWELILPQLTVSDEGNGTGSLIIQMSDAADEYVIADAILVRYVGPVDQALRAADTYVRLSSLTEPAPQIDQTTLVGEVSPAAAAGSERKLEALKTNGTSAKVSDSRLTAGVWRPMFDLPPSGDAVKYFELTETGICERSGQSSPSLRDGRALWPGEGGLGDYHQEPREYFSTLPARSSRPSRREGKEYVAERSPPGHGAAAKTTMAILTPHLVGTVFAEVDDSVLIPIA